MLPYVLIEHKKDLLGASYTDWIRGLLSGLTTNWHELDYPIAASKPPQPELLTEIPLKESGADNQQKKKLKKNLCITLCLMAFKKLTWLCLNGIQSKNAANKFVPGKHESYLHLLYNHGWPNSSLHAVSCIYRKQQFFTVLKPGSGEVTVIMHVSVGWHCSSLLQHTACRAQSGSMEGQKQPLLSL